MAINDIYEVTHVMYDDGTQEEFMNKWYYNQVEIGGDAEGLWDAWTAVGGMMEFVNGIQSVHAGNRRVKVINLFSLTDFHEEGVTGAGTKTGDMLPLFNALNISLKLDSRGVKPGSKRIGGMTEVGQVGGVITDAGTISSINALLAQIPQDVVIPLTAVWDPIVVKRIPVAATETTSAHYRLPANAGEAEYAHVVAAIASLRLSHQVSRGNGR